MGSLEAETLMCLKIKVLLNREISPAQVLLGRKMGQVKALLRLMERNNKKHYRLLS